ncbi:uncharacterized protein LOC143153049 [Ptiloglossa arizonensis]|uniref:uncharacterized protein LOC143153049 n=1 Tax=Ptiloglossa arizonensis TaxID=3350558 RepID=UPI003FA016B8
MTGVLVSIAAVSRLMEFSISFIHPMTIFMLRQSGKLVICLINQSAKLMTRTLDRMCKKDCRGTMINIGRTEPEVPFIVQEIDLLVNNERFNEVDTIIGPIEPTPVEDEQENSNETIEVPEQVAEGSA